MAEKTQANIGFGIKGEVFMSKKLTNRLCILLGTSLILLLCTILIIPIKASAKEWPSIGIIQVILNEIKMGEEKSDVISNKLRRRYQFSTDTESRVTIFIQVESLEKNEFAVAEKDADECIATQEDFKCVYDKKSKRYNCTYTFNSNGEKYHLYIINRSIGSMPYTLLVTSEPQINLSTTTISEITNTKSHTMTVKYAPVKKRLGYQIEYADNSKFNNKTRVNTGATTKDIGKLTIGKTYYVRVRSYARYNDGTLVYSKWSGTRKIKIRK